MPRRKKDDEMTDEQRQALTFQHERRYTTLLLAKKASDAALKNHCKVVKAELGDGGLADIKSKIELSTPEGEDRFKAEVERMMRVARWMGLSVGAQADLFNGDDEPAVDRKFADGKRHGLAGEPCKPDADPSTEQYREYMRGFHEGQAVLAKGIHPTPDDDDVRPRFLKDTGAMGSAPSTEKVVTN